MVRKYVGIKCPEIRRNTGFLGVLLDKHLESLYNSMVSAKKAKNKGFLC